MVISKNIKTIKINPSKSESKSLGLLRDSIIKQVDVYQNKLNSLKQDLSNILLKLESKYKELDLINSKLENNKSLIDQSMVELDQLNTIKHKYGDISSKELSELINKYNSLTKEIETNKNINDSLLNDIEINKIKLLELVKQNDNTKDNKILEYNKLITKFNNEIKYLSDKKIELNDNINFLNKEIENKNYKLSNLKEMEFKLDNLKKEIENKINNKEKIESEINILLGNKINLKKKKEYYDQLIHNISEKELILTKYNKTNEDVNELEINKIKLKKELDKLTSYFEDINYKLNSDINQDKELNIIIKQKENQILNKENLILDLETKENMVSKNIIIKDNDLKQKEEEYNNICKKINNEINLLSAKKSEILHLIMVNKQHLKNQKVADFIKEIENGKQ